MFADELNFEHAQKLAELEQARQQKLKERQKVYEEAFNQDVEQYLSTGYLDYRGKLLTIEIETYFVNNHPDLKEEMLKCVFLCLSAEQKGLDVSVLDQMTINNSSDQEAFDDFLNSIGDDISPGSSMTSGNQNTLRLG